jgi:hypothetical protein
MFITRLKVASNLFNSSSVISKNNPEPEHKPNTNKTLTIHASKNHTSSYSVFNFLDHACMIYLSQLATTPIF